MKLIIEIEETKLGSVEVHLSKGRAIITPGRN
jgi:hypothetical protein